jgi:tetratricopeptide (TPR) repeat protein
MTACLGLALLASSCSSSTPPPKSSSKAKASSKASPFSTDLGAGIVLLNRDNPNAAEQLFEKAIKANDHNAIAYYDLGVSLQDQHQTSTALAAYTNALNIDSRYVPALYNKATIESAAQPAQAIALYRRIVEIQPDAPTTYLNLGLLEAAQPAGAAQAHAYLQTAVTLEPSLYADIPAALRTGITDTAG